MQRSQLQREVIKLYRELLRASKGKNGMKEHVQLVFRENADIPKRNYIHIEYLLRRGQRQLKTLEVGEVTKVRSFK